MALMATLRLELGVFALEDDAHAAVAQHLEDAKRRRAGRSRRALRRGQEIGQLGRVVGARCVFARCFPSRCSDGRQAAARPLEHRVGWSASLVERAERLRRHCAALRQATAGRQARATAC